MSLTGYLKSLSRRPFAALAKWRLSRQFPARSLERATWEQSLREPSDFYRDCARYFWHRLPAELREHRAYFHNVPQNRRGFGEDAFHTMWYLLLEEFQPANFLEIGVFRGQVISLVALWVRLERQACEVHGISPFSSAGDSLSKYSSDVDYYEDVLLNFKHFGLAPPHLLRAFSTDAEAVQLIASRQWDMMYIDGNHDYEIALRDWENCSAAVRAGGIIVLDDSGLTTSFRPPIFASGGIPGPSRVAKEIDRTRFRELLQVGHNRVFQKV